MMYFCEIIGTIAFAVSGAMVAVKCGMDLFGILVLGTVTALGGGCMRDLMLGQLPPNIFRGNGYLTVAAITSLLVFLFIKFKKKFVPYQIFQWVLNLTDAIGLGLFSCIGVNQAIRCGYGQYAAFSIFMGVLTGVGGGLLRDIFACQKPVILTKNIYACASLAGAGFYYLMVQSHMKGSTAIVVSSCLIVLIRISAAYYRWNLPKAI